YVPGDDLRHVLWPTTAKSGELMVRHEAEEETLHALIVIDLDRPEQAPDELETEFLIAAAAAAGVAFLRADYEVCVDAPGHEIRFRGQKDVDRLRLLTALIEPGRAELPAHDDPNHVVICAADDSRAEAMA
ncbi:DUF58 domain-containing protein, partial [Burkholderia multivorans]|uniref:DUF58 domain-containing protein n=1 Tax=Burkholderia multivorans TaxID=87883 RepID=UPI000DB20729